MKSILFVLFITAALAYDVDVCRQPKEVGLCKAHVPRWFYNDKSKACERFVYGGCGANDNNFLNRCDCQNRCGDKNDICCEYKNVGPCSEKLPRWFYNRTGDSCDRFEYGGCKGNGNNFECSDDCEKKCL